MSKNSIHYQTDIYVLDPEAEYQDIYRESDRSVGREINFLATDEIPICKVLLPINPNHVDDIFTGIKKFEYRKTRCRKEIHGIIIYATSPVSRIVGEVEVTQIIEGTPEDVWNRTSYAAGISNDFFGEYYRGRKKAVAYALGQHMKYQKTLELKDIGVKHAPQSYIYLRGRGFKE